MNSKLQADYIKIQNESLKKYPQGVQTVMDSDVLQKSLVESSVHALMRDLLVWGLAHHKLDGLAGDPAYPLAFAASMSFDSLTLQKKNPPTDSLLRNPMPNYAEMGVGTVYLFLERQGLAR